ncbi:hypothetical protein LIER_43214 [Lithospermum erythrorhizon]|uniref:Uncharacterized protein n=1 Tax=Lithospermum erythrorhizon TaxID=34254 RepID=A0AAV3PTF1_LITER
MNWSQLIGNKVKLVAHRSLSLVDRYSAKLEKLCNRVDYLDHDAGKALMVDMEDYLETHKVQSQVEYQDSISPFVGRTVDRDMLNRDSTMFLSFRVQFICFYSDV